MVVWSFLSTLHKILNNMEISNTELKALELLSSGMSLDDAGKKLGIGNGIHSLIHNLEKEGLISIEENVDEYLALGQEGEKYASVGMPERRAITILRRGPVEIREIPRRAELEDHEVPIALMWLKKKDWASIEKGLLSLTPSGQKALIEKGKDEELLDLLRKGRLLASELEGFEEAIKFLKDRKNNLVSKEIRKFDVEVTKDGKKVLKAPSKFVKDESDKLSALNHEIIKSGSWKDREFRPYNVSQAEEVYTAKLHPLRVAIDKIRRIFLEMGFTEATGNFVESSFWNFDALFQPQDHPARDLADTFYIEDLCEELPEHHKGVKEAHESGGSMVSKGWGYEWDAGLAKQCVLRTHTTAVSARSLTKVKIPAKVFSIGRVFRNETLDYKHLAEFYQVEGIVVGEDVNFTNLLWYLREFYTKLGFKKVRFRPSYFPYTEMSCEPEVYFEEKKEWVELGGSGIFRPEVVKPLLGVEAPVLAWGLSLERPVMLKMGLDDLRTFYKNDLDWLRGYRVTEVL
ncbi:MAG: phenylalanine--tRNA ligase subunit alpha [Candidatus Altiarchaeota archaeon]|nr:phenylalanine--tRNA ligase subunit alpha [Candidatus Altiarchaeota archaeon]